MNWKVLIVITLLLEEAQSKFVCDGLGSDKPSMQPFLARSCNRLSERVYRSLPRSGNVVYSPFSTCGLLAAFTSVSGNKTLSEIRKRMSLYLLDKRETSEIYGRIQDSFADVSNVTLSSSSTMVFHENRMLEKNEAEDLMKSCNGTFVSKGSHRDTRSVLNQNRFYEESGLDVVNKLHLFVRCSGQFRGSQVVKFYVERSRGLRLPMMKCMGRTFKRRMMKSQVFELPLEGDRFNLYVVMPRPKTTLRRLERKFLRKGLSKFIRWVEDNKKTLNKEILLPNFGSASKPLELKKPLEDSGIKSLFNPDGGISRLSQGRGVYVEDAVQQAGIEFEGIENDAQQNKELDNTTGSSRPAIVKRPFLYVVQDTHTGFTMFLGRYTGPELKDLKSD